MWVKMTDSAQECQLTSWISK